MKKTEISLQECRERIKERRKELKITLKELAEKASITEATMQRYESGKIKTIPYDTLTVIADALETSPADLMGWEWQDSIQAARSTRRKYDGEKVAERIVALRQHYKLTRSQFAKIAGTYADTVESWESGERIPTPDTIRTICQYFDIHPSEMLDSEHELNLAKSIPPESIRNITSQEAELLYYFDQLNEEGRAAILSTALAFTGMPQYKKCDTDDANLKNA